MGIRKFFGVLKTRRSFARIERAWDGSVHKREIESERDLPPRPLTAEEENLLRWILEHGSEEARSFLPQIEGMKAVRSCICGCPTVELKVDEGAPLGDRNAHSPLCDFMGRTAKGELVGVMLFQGGGKLSCLEGYSLDGEAGPPDFGFPTIDSLKEFQTGNPA
jgi:hypothetical protein